MLSLLCLISLSCAGPPDEGAAAAAGDTQPGSEEAFDAHKQYVTLHFPDSEMDFAFQWVLGSISMGGCEIGEAFTAAGSITSGDATSWQTEWAAMGARVEARGRTSLAAGHEVSAREQLQRAANYYRASLISMLPDNPNFEANALKSRELLKEAGQLWEPPLEYFEIEFEDTVLTDTPAWVAHSVVPVAFALLSYRFLVSVLQTAVENFVGQKGADE